MAFTFVDVLSLIPTVRLSTCLHCARSHTGQKISRIQAKVDSLAFPPYYETLPQLSSIATEMLCTAHKTHSKMYADEWFKDLQKQATFVQPDMPGTYQETTTFTLEPRLKHRREVMQRKYTWCRRCMEYFKEGETVYATNSGPWWLCDPKCGVKPEGPPQLRTCRVPPNTEFWAWTYGATDPYVRYNLWKPHIRLRIEHNGAVVAHIMYGSSSPFWPLLRELCDRFSLDPASANFYWHDGDKLTQIRRFDCLDKVGCMFYVMCLRDG
jgi:hypothetical protein